MILLLSLHIMKDDEIKIDLNDIIKVIITDGNNNFFEYLISLEELLESEQSSESIVERLGNNYEGYYIDSIVVS